LLRFLALFVAKFGSVTPMVDDLGEMFGRRDVVGLGDCYRELPRILLPRTLANSALEELEDGLLDRAVPFDS
jgi:hypothetical protein